MSMLCYDASVGDIRCVALQYCTVHNMYSSQCAYSNVFSGTCTVRSHLETRYSSTVQVRRTEHVHVLGD